MSERAGVQAALTELAGLSAENPYAFAQAHLRTERAEYLDFGGRPYLIDVLRDRRREHVCVACAQSGKTVSYLAKVFWHLMFPGAKRSRTAIYTFPTKEDVTEFSAARAKTMLRSSPLMAQSQGDVDQAGLKKLTNGSAIYFRGTWTDRAAISVPADLRVHDELDRSKPDTLQVYADRLRNSDLAITYLFSTPTIPGFGISREWERSDQSEWMWTCGECCAEQVAVPMDGSVSWTAHLDTDAGLWRCCHCQAPVERAWILQGRWVPMAPGNADVAGYHISGIMPDQVGAARICTEYRKALTIERWLQGQMGLPAVAGDGRITPDMICFGDEPNAESSAVDTYAGLDQGRKLDMVIGDGKGRIVAVHRFDGWDQVRSAMNLFRIRTLVVDGQPEMRPAQELAGAFPGRVLLADYSMRAVEAEPYERVKREPRVHMHRTGCLDWARDRIVMGPAGGDVWPALEYTLERELVAQLCASLRTLEEDAAGNPRAVWRETGPDHFRHAHAYYTVATVMSKGSVSLADWKGPGRQQQVIETSTGRVLTLKQFPDEPPDIVAEDRMENRAVAEALVPRYPKFHRVDE